MAISMFATKAAGDVRQNVFASDVRPVQPWRKSPSEGGDEAILIVEDDALVRRYVVTQVRASVTGRLSGQRHRGLTIIDHGGKIDLLFTVRDDAGFDQRSAARH